jgi:hypothetical protein
MLFDFFDQASANILFCLKNSGRSFAPTQQMIFVLIFFMELIGMKQWSLEPSLVRELKGNVVRRKPILRLPPQL